MGNVDQIKVHQDLGNKISERTKLKKELNDYVLKRDRDYTAAYTNRRQAMQRSKLWVITGAIGVVLCAAAAVVGLSQAYGPSLLAIPGALVCLFIFGYGILTLRIPPSQEELALLGKAETIFSSRRKAIEEIAWGEYCGNKYGKIRYNRNDFLVTFDDTAPDNRQWQEGWDDNRSLQHDPAWNRARLHYSAGQWIPGSMTSGHHSRV